MAFVVTMFNIWFTQTMKLMTFSANDHIHTTDACCNFFPSIVKNASVYAVNTYAAVRMCKCVASVYNLHKMKRDVERTLYVLSV